LLACLSGPRRLHGRTCCLAAPQELYKEFGWPLYRIYGHAFEAFKTMVVDDGAAVISRLENEHEGPLKVLTPEVGQCSGLLLKEKTSNRTAEPIPVHNIPVHVAAVASHGPPWSVSVHSGHKTGVLLECVLKKVIHTSFGVLVCSNLQVSAHVLTTRMCRRMHTPIVCTRPCLHQHR